MSKKYVIILPTHIYNKLNEIKDRLGVSRSSIVREAVMYYLNELEQKYPIKTQ